jgi:hypothetical protein
VAACRYCGKPLPLLERISGPSAFCSREHRQQFQAECSRMALKRLLGEESVRPSGGGVAEGETKAVAVAERVMISAPPVAPGAPVGPDAIGVRRGAPPRLPAPEWSWRVDSEPSQRTRVTGSPPDAARPVELALANMALAVEAAPVVLAPPAAPSPVRIPAPVAEPPAPAPPAEPVEIEAPAFASSVGASFWSRLPLVVRLGLVTVVLALCGTIAYRFLSQAPGPVPATAQADLVRSTPMGPGGWFNRDMPDRTGGRVRAGTFSIYRPSLELADYRIEFSGRIEQASLGWFVRYTDPDNYQAMKLTEQGGRLTLTRWLVFNGENLAREDLPLSGLGSGFPLHRVRVDVKGPRYTVQVDGQPAGAWTDDRLRRGGFGFLNEGDERGRIESVQLFLLGP